MNWKLYLNIARLFLLALTISGFSMAQEIGPDSSSNDAYTIKVDLPQSIVQDLTVTDTLPQGLIYQSGSLEVIGTDASPSETVSSPNDGTEPVTLTWSLGQVDNSADQDVLLRFLPVVADVARNKDGETLAASHVSLQFTDDNGEVYTASGETASVKLVEPDLEIVMSSGQDEGKTVTYSASVDHTSESHADAYGTDLSILLPTGMTYSPGSAEIVSGPPGVLDDADPKELKIHFNEIDRSWKKDNMVLLQFRATTTAENGADRGEIKAGLTWKSAPGNNLGTRSYLKSQSIPVPEYVPSYSLSLNSVAETDPVEAGQSLLYTINYANTGKDDVHGATIKETFDQSATYLSAVPAIDADKEDMWTIGDLKAGESGTIKLVVRVKPDIADDTMLENRVKLSCLEKATAEAITKTVVKGKSDKQITKASSNNSTNSTEFDDSAGVVLSNDTENSSVSIPIENNTKLDPVSDEPENVTSLTNLTLTAEPTNDSSSMDSGQNDTKFYIDEPENSTNQDLATNAQNTDSIIESQAKSDANASQYDASAKEPIITETPSSVDPSQVDSSPVDPSPIDQSQFVSDPTEDVLDQAGTAAAENPSGMESDDKNGDQKNPDTISDVSTLSFSDGTKVDVVFAESSFGSDTAYAVLHEEDNGLSISSLQTDGSESNASSVNTTAMPESAVNQTDPKVNQTEPIETIAKIAAIESNSADNSTILSNTGAVTTETAAAPPEQVNPPTESTNVQLHSLESSEAEENPSDSADDSADGSLADSADQQFQ